MESEHTTIWYVFALIMISPFILIWLVVMDYLDFFMSGILMAISFGIGLGIIMVIDYNQSGV